MSVFGRVHETGGVDNPNQNVVADDDDWETDPDFVNDVGEEGQRWGAKTLPEGEKPTNIHEVRSNAFKQHDEVVNNDYNQKKTLYGGDRE